MLRELRSPRAGWERQMEAIGFDYHSIDGVYWDESRCYRFTADEIDRLEAATAELHRCCVAAARHVIRSGRCAEFGISEDIVALVERSFEAHELGQPGGFSLFGRMDLSFDGRSDPKLLEYNADTPTACLEASVAQWKWLQAVRPQADQFNSIHERLIAAWRSLREGEDGGADGVLHFTSAGPDEAPEDWGNLEYLRDTAVQAGWRTVAVPIDRIGHDGIGFVDLENRPIELLFKLYPWEWMVQEAFGAHLPSTRTRMIEPAWKMLLSNKMLLVVLWELFPGHPNLLPAYDEPSRLQGRYARKPRLAREGANVALVDGERVEQADGPYDDRDAIYQALAPLPRFGDDHLLVGSWIVGGEPAGIGLREDTSAITRNTSRFVPHYFD